MMTDNGAPAGAGAASQAPQSSGRRWAPRCWLGSSLPVWLALLRKNRFAIDAGHAYIAVADTLVSPINSALGLAEACVYGARIRRQPLPAEPIFILGHWRTGTTLLHELLCQDPRYAAPTLFDCMVPHHFLLTHRVLKRALWFCAPQKRPQDDMAIAWDSPCEDEFALCLLGARSPYETLAFPNHGPMTADMFDPEEFSAEDRLRWRNTLARFLRRVSLHYPGRRLVLKSPPHMCRLRTLLELFPRARFVHIVRNPYDVFPSTVRTWKVFHRTQGFQKPHDAHTEEMVLSLLPYMYGCLERDRERIPAGNLLELKFEDLVREPVAVLTELYQHAGLGDFEPARPGVERYLAQRSSYRHQSYRLDDRQRQQVHDRWGSIIRRYDYDRQPPHTPAALHVARDSVR